jgi:1,4-dihydroxy-2-naphthoyl-CoA hydrolase
VVEDAPKDMHVFEEIAGARFPGLLGIEVLEIAHGRSRMRLDIEPKHLAPNGYLHAGVVVGLADSACGYGCVASFPPGVTNFATIELKTNFLGTATDGSIECLATLTHGGRTTQVWDAEVTVGERSIALFRCTQLLLSSRT